MSNQIQDQPLGTIPGLIILSILLAFLFYMKPPADHTINFGADPEQARIDFVRARVALFNQLEQNVSMSQSIGQVSSHVNDGKKSVIKLDSGRFVGISPIFHVDVGVEVRKASGAIVENVFGEGSVVYCLNGDKVSCHHEVFVTDIKKKTS